jgi:hypothetical protein
MVMTRLSGERNNPSLKPLAAEHAISQGFRVSFRPHQKANPIEGLAAHFNWSD